MRVRSRTLGLSARATDGQGRPRRGIVIVLTCVLLIALFGFVAFGVDIGTIGLEKSRMQNGVDAAALAASQRIQEEITKAAKTLNPQGDIAAQIAALNAVAVEKAKQTAIEVAQLNGVYLDSQRDIEFGRKLSDGAVSYGTPPYNLVKVTARRTNPDTSAPDGQLKLAFAPVMGFDSTSLMATAAAFVQSRDIVLVLDYSGSMNDDSEFMAMGTLGKSAVEQNMDQMYQALAESDVRFSDRPTQKKFPKVSKHGDKVYGDISYGAGEWVDDRIAAVYALTKAYHKSGMTRQQLRDKINAESTSKVESAVKSLSENDVISGAEKFSKTDAEWLMNNVNSSRLNAALGKMSSDNIAIGLAKKLGVLEKNAQGKPATPWPQEGLESDEVTPKGTPSVADNNRMWRDYVKWVRSDSSVNKYGYRNRFGTRTMLGYMLASKTMKTQSEDLHRAPAYPFHAMKEGTTAFLEFLKGLKFGDMVGVVSYAGASSYDTYDNRETARFETYVQGDPNTPRMTDDYDEINNIQIERQAAEYSNYTGIGYGIKKAREMHARAGRPDARKVIMVLTDGNANRSREFDGLPRGWKWSDFTDFNGDGKADYTTSDQNKQFAFAEAMSPVVIPESGVAVQPLIHAMSVGATADRDMMQALAFAGGGLWIDVPGGTTISEMQSQMLKAFAEIASAVPSAQLLREGDY